MRLGFEMMASSKSYRKVSCYLPRKTLLQQQAQSDFGRNDREGRDIHLKCSHSISRTRLLTLVPICNYNAVASSVPLVARGPYDGKTENTRFIEISLNSML